MARAYLAGPTLSAALIVLLLSSSSVWSFTVHDPTTHAKLAEELNKLQRMIEEIQEQKRILEDQMKAIGKAAQITLPNLNLEKLTRSVRKTVQCSILTKDDLLRMMPGVGLEDIDISSVCQGRRLYGNVLFGQIHNGDGFNDLSVRDQKKAEVRENEIVRRRREALQKDAVIKGLALSDVAIKEGEDLSQAVTDLEAQASSAQNQNDRLAVIAQGIAIMSRAMAMNNQLLALILKNQSLEAANLYLPARDGVDVTGGENND